MAGGNFIQWFLHGIVAVRVKDGHHPVYSAMFQQFPYAEIILMYRFEWQQFLHIGGIVVFQYLQCLFMQRHSDCLRLAFLGLLRHIFQESVFDIGSCKSVKVAHTAADITVEHENITDNRQFRIVAQVCIV